MPSSSALRPAAVIIVGGQERAMIRRYFRKVNTPLSIPLISVCNCDLSGHLEPKSIILTKGRYYQVGPTPPTVKEASYNQHLNVSIRWWRGCNQLVQLYHLLKLNQLLIRLDYQQHSVVVHDSKVQGTAVAPGAFAT